VRRTFQQLITLPPRLLGSLLEHGKGHRMGQVRWQCTGVWLTPSDPGFAGPRSLYEWKLWRLPKLALLSATSPAGGPFARFSSDKNPTLQSGPSLMGLQVIATGMAFLQTAHGWLQEYKKEHLPAPDIRPKPV
jgi:hypothetical protein